MTLLEATGIAKIYTDMAVPVTVLSDLDFRLDAGELAGVFGASGSGKSTLLHILGGLDRPTSGRVDVDGESLSAMKEDDLARFRCRRVGFVFQFYHLLPEFTAVENAMLPSLIAGKAADEARSLAEKALSAVGLGARMEHRPAMLSGGEQQRVAIARAAANKPSLILADEPTGNLDAETGARIMEYLLDLNRSLGTAMVIVTHNRDLLGLLPLAYELRDGRLHVIAKRT